MLTGLEGHPRIMSGDAGVEYTRGREGLGLGAEPSIHRRPRLVNVIRRADPTPRLSARFAGARLLGLGRFLPSTLAGGEPNRLEQTREEVVDRTVAARDAAMLPDGFGVHEAGLSEDLEVVGHRRLGDVVLEVQVAAELRSVGGDPLEDVSPDRV